MKFLSRQIWSFKALKSLNDFTSRADECKADVDSHWEQDGAIGPVTSASGSGDSADADCYSVKVKAAKSPKSKSPKRRA